MPRLAVRTFFIASRLYRSGSSTVRYDHCFLRPHAVKAALQKLILTPTNRRTRTVAVYIPRHGPYTGRQSTIFFGKATATQKRRPQHETYHHWMDESTSVQAVSEGYNHASMTTLSNKPKSEDLNTRQITTVWMEVHQRTQTLRPR